MQQVSTPDSLETSALPGHRAKRMAAGGQGRLLHLSSRCGKGVSAPVAVDAQEGVLALVDSGRLSACGCNIRRGRGLRDRPEPHAAVCAG